MAQGHEEFTDRERWIQLSGQLENLAREVNSGFRNLDGKLVEYHKEVEQHDRHLIGMDGDKDGGLVGRVRMLERDNDDRKENLSLWKKASVGQTVVLIGMIVWEILTKVFAK